MRGPRLDRPSLLDIDDPRRGGRAGRTAAPTTQLLDERGHQVSPATAGALPGPPRLAAAIRFFLAAALGKGADKKENTGG